MGCWLLSTGRGGETGTGQDRYGRGHASGKSKAGGGSGCVSGLARSAPTGPLSLNAMEPHGIFWGAGFLSRDTIPSPPRPIPHPMVSSYIRN